MSKQIPLCAVLFIMRKRKIEHGKGNPRMSLHLNRAPLRKIAQRFTGDHTSWKRVAQDTEYSNSVLKWVGKARCDNNICPLRTPEKQRGLWEPT